MYGFVKQIILGLLSVGGLLAMECVSKRNQPCQSRSSIGDINSSDPLYYPC